MYSLADYGSMIADTLRMDPYALALKRAVKPNSVVLDIGAATGIHSLLAAKFGAKKVYAVEPNEAIHLARRMAVANGFGERIEFIQDLSTNITLPEPVDVIVSDLRGILPLFSCHIPALIDARGRLMAPGGIMIPHKDTLWLTLVESRHAYNDIVRPWDYPYGLNMDDAKVEALNSWSQDNTEDITSRNLLCEPQKWAVLDYDTVLNPNIGSSLITCTAQRDGTAHGIFVWFDAELMDGVGFSNGPLRIKSAEVYGRGFFPLLEPVAIQAGDTIILSLSAELVDSEYIWRWETGIYNGDDRNAPRAKFRQSTDYAESVERSELSNEVSKLMPVLGADGQTDRFILEKMDGRTSLEDIAQATMSQFPNRFQSRDAAVQYVYDLFRYYRE